MASVPLIATAQPAAVEAERPATWAKPLTDQPDLPNLHRVDQALYRGARLGQFLGGPMQQPDVRIGALDDLAVKLEHQPQHPVRRRMLRAKVHGVVLDFRHGSDPSNNELGCRLTCACASQASRGQRQAGRSQSSWWCS